MNKVPINIEELGIKLESMITFGKVKLSQLFVVIGHPEENYYEHELDENFILNLKENLADKDGDLTQLVDTSKIKVFFSKECIKWVNGTPHYAKYVLDRRKFNYPQISKISARPFGEVNSRSSHILQ